MTVGISVARVSPFHIGHQRLIGQMIEDCGIERCLGFIGSCASQISWKNLFTYNDRKRWYKTLFPHLRILGMPDTADWDIENWLSMLDDYIEAIFGKSDEVIFYGGDTYDIRFFIENQRKTVIVNRYDHTRISATDIRNLLLEKQDISKLIDPRIHDDVVATFKKRNDQFMRYVHNKENL